MNTLEEPLALPLATYMEAITHHGEELAVAAEAAGPDSPVPTCPGWSVLDLVQHTEAVFRHKTAVVLAADEPESPEWQGVEDEVDVAAYRRTLSRMLAVFNEADLAAACATWCSHDHRADWWVRRMAHEAAIHGADAVVASGHRPRIDPLLATDGVDEILDEMLVGGPAWGTVTPGIERIDLVGDNRTWCLRFGRFVGTSPNTGNDYDIATLLYDTHGRPDAVVTADPALLDLWLWGRADLKDSNISGDAGTVARLRELAAEGTQ